ncbi:MAG: alpha/beta fold hydrolase [Actinomycetota bacterium]|nr:alpha/beta fold hydrolase [Actinomycetota bacterium]
MAVATLVLAACTGDDDDESSATSSTTTPATTGDATTDDTGPGTTDTTGDTVDESEFTVAPLAWEPCADLDGFECATLVAPVDHDDPEGETLDVAVIRQPASDTDERIGSLVFNPGGPGGSGITFLADAAPVVPAELAARFDLVSFDPRGVGRSTPIECNPDPARELAIIPDRASGFAEVAAYNVELAQSCAERYGDLLDHLGTVDVAHDLDLLRRALGDDGLNYVGLSYGTTIGAVYAELHGEHARALILDGGVAPDLDLVEDTRLRAVRFDEAFARLDAMCASEPECPLAEAGLAQTWDGVLASVLESPLPTADPARTLDAGLFYAASAVPLYTTDGWQLFTFALDDAAGGDGTALLFLADLYTERADDGTYPNSSEMFTAVDCADDPAALSAEEAVALAEEVAPAAPRWGDLLVAGTLQCASWPAEGEGLPEISGADAPPVLVIGTTHDPATPFEWSQRLADALDSATLVTFAGDGHTAFAAGGCVDDLYVEYLVDLTVPDDALVCPSAGYLGAQLDSSGGAVTVADVAPNSAAAAAGLTPGDVVVEVDGEPVGAIDDLVAAGAGAQVTYTVERAGARQQLAATLGARPWTLPPG